MKNKRLNEMVWGGILIATLLVAYTFFSERGLVKSRVLSMERDAIVSKVNAIEADNRSLSANIESLRGNMETIEKTARTELDLVREDEILFKFNK
ncbi:MAG: septum formation initiator family protein [Proteobacteria bacterium]|nr:septum formation initiator family protein [Pseudomonadota bacterium]